MENIDGIFLGVMYIEERCYFLMYSKAGQRLCWFFVNDREEKLEVFELETFTGIETDRKASEEKAYKMLSLVILNTKKSLDKLRNKIFIYDIIKDNRKNRRAA
jgi:hypothetical protein